jgi:heme-degrading monooxygenase HmoA
VDARLLVFRGVEDFDAGLLQILDAIAPVLHHQRGYRGVSLSVNRSERVLATYSLWDTESDREASALELGEAWEKAHNAIGGSMTVERFEQTSEHITRPPVPGCLLNEVRVRVDPDFVDGAVSFFTNEMLPLLSSLPGFYAVRNMVDRQTGRGISHSFWSDRRALEAVLRGLPDRLEAAQVKGIRINEVMQREVVLAETV